MPGLPDGVATALSEETNETDRLATAAALRGVLTPPPAPPPAAAAAAAALALVTLPGSRKLQ